MKKWLIVCLLLVIAWYPVGEAGAAGENYERLTWESRSGGMQTWHVGLTAEQTREIMHALTDVTASGGIARALAGAYLGPFASPVTFLAAMSALGRLALDRCSNRGRDGVVIFVYSRIGWGTEIYVDERGNPAYRDVETWHHFPYWCRSQ